MQAPRAPTSRQATVPHADEPQATVPHTTRMIGCQGGGVRRGHLPRTAAARAAGGSHGARTAGAPTGRRPWLYPIVLQHVARSGNPAVLELLLGVGHPQGVEHLVDFPQHEAVEIVDRQADAVVGDAALREIVGADLGTAIAG